MRGTFSARMGRGEIQPRLPGDVITMDFYDAVHARHSIRLFKSDPVDREIIERLMGAAATAPSSMNAQPWHYHVATGKTRDAVSEIMSLSTLHLRDYVDMLDEDHMKAAEQFFATLGNAPVAIALSVPIPEGDLDRINTYVAAGCSLENLMLAAAVEGIGCCSITFSFWVRDRLAEALSIPDDREIISLIVLGWPAEKPETTTRNHDIATYQG